MFAGSMLPVDDYTPPPVQTPLPVQPLPPQDYGTRPGSDYAFNQADVNAFVDAGNYTSNQNNRIDPNEWLEQNINMNNRSEVQNAVGGGGFEDDQALLSQADAYLNPVYNPVTDQPYKADQLTEFDNWNPEWRDDDILDAQEWADYQLQRDTSGWGDLPQEQQDALADALYQGANDERINDTSRLGLQNSVTSLFPNFAPENTNTGGDILEYPMPPLSERADAYQIPGDGVDGQNGYFKPMTQHAMGNYGDDREPTPYIPLDEINPIQYTNPITGKDYDNIDQLIAWDVNWDANQNNRVDAQEWADYQLRDGASTEWLALPIEHQAMIKDALIKGLDNNNINHPTKVLLADAINSAWPDSVEAPAADPAADPNAVDPHTGMTAEQMAGYAAWVAANGGTPDQEFIYTEGPTGPIEILNPNYDKAKHTFDADAYLENNPDVADLARRDNWAETGYTAYDHWIDYGQNESNRQHWQADDWVGDPRTTTDGGGTTTTPTTGDGGTTTDEFTNPVTGTTFKNFDTTRDINSDGVYDIHEWWQFQMQPDRKETWLALPIEHQAMIYNALVDGYRSSDLSSVEKSALEWKILDTWPEPQF
tara:strand:+ start:691 stop:2472 length:1782 start_codon:yes stop_codon:yes gene_type:complete